MSERNVDKVRENSLEMRRSKTSGRSDARPAEVNECSRTDTESGRVLKSEAKISQSSPVEDEQ